MFLGIDIGGTNIRIGEVVDGALTEVEARPSFSRSFTLDQTIEYLKDIIRGHFSGEVEGIGIGVPSIVDSQRGIVYSTVNIPSWKEVPLKDLLEKEFCVPVKVNNDSNCFALGAYKSVVCFEPDSFVGVTLGTGVGVGIIYKGQLLEGAYNGAGELGCIPFGDADLESTCSSKFFESRGTSGKEVAMKAAAGDPDALAVFHEFGWNLGRVVSIIMYAYDPEIVMFGGGIAQSFKYFKGGIMDYLKEYHAYPVAVEHLRLEAISGDNMAPLGAALL